MNRAFTNILCDNVETNARFYEDILDMHRRNDFGWFIIMGSDDLPGLELGLLDKAHETVPPVVAQPPAGLILTFVVEDVAVCHRKAVAEKAEIVEEPTDLPYGQTRLLLRDPAGTIVDISSPTP
ncbi:VOC family protein [Cognatiyoonia sp. IB215446]|uniref:VOC family protein n=1 Tax=Cognatiyoonia sp. IB215446 TaxID=3097355 RepID=UPI002A0BEB1E|nr:VOC family protein [Cognatiyoonia sp. IB215446]MDX8346740.1 VOC family protein [Cognatiyoonia sp. IB215446]